MPQVIEKQDTHSVEEFEAAVLAMTAVDRNRLSTVARMLQGSMGMTWQDLVQEAYARAYEGRRAWPLTVDVVRFLIGAMESIADEARKATVRQRLLVVAAGDSCPANTEGVASRTGKLLEIRRTTPSAEDQAVASEEAAATARRLVGWRDKLLSVFEDDDEAQLIVIGMMDGLKGNALQAAAGLTEAGFPSKYKKVHRRIQALQKRESSHGK